MTYNAGHYYTNEYNKGFNLGNTDYFRYVKPRCGSYHSDAFREGYEDGWNAAEEKENFIRAPGDPF